MEFSIFSFHHGVQRGVSNGVQHSPFEKQILKHSSAVVVARAHTLGGGALFRAALCSELELQGGVCRRTVAFRMAVCNVARNQDMDEPAQPLVRVIRTKES